MEAEQERAEGAGRGAYSAALIDHFRRVHPDFWKWEQSKIRIGFALGVVTAAAVSIAIFFVLAYVVKPAYNPGSILAAVTLASFALPYALITRRGASKFKARWQQEGRKISPPQENLYKANTSGSSLDYGASDASILNLANDLTRQLNISVTPFSHIIWQDSLTRGRTTLPIPGDAVIFRDGTIILASSMEGQLSLDQWRPLFGSALINKWKLGPRRIKRILTILVPTIVLYVAGWLLLPPLFPTTTSCANGQCAVNNLAWDVLIILLPAIVVIVTIVGVLTIRSFSRIADRETASSFGKEQLISSLRRVSEVSPADDWSVQKRINRLA